MKQLIAIIAVLLLLATACGSPKAASPAEPSLEVETSQGTVGTGDSAGSDIVDTTSLEQDLTELDTIEEDLNLDELDTLEQDLDLSDLE